jgi:hypothetical protein
MYEVRDADERVIPLHKSGYVLVYTKEYFADIEGHKKVRLLILDTFLERRNFVQIFTQQ